MSSVYELSDADYPKPLPHWVISLSEIPNDFRSCLSVSLSHLCTFGSPTQVLRVDYAYSLLLIMRCTHHASLSQTSFALSAFSN